ncbi:MAG: peptidylprolyl isomerase [Alphaproteobacteria bacterium]|nr:peptidylprolyl isomerase [Alphaproteobacteria bacterium]
MTPRPARAILPALAALLLAGAVVASGEVANAAPQAAAGRGAAAKPPAARPEAEIVAIVNGAVISNGDVTNRGRLFALSTGMGISPEILDRLRPQITRQLIDERLRLQEVQRRHIIVSDKDIAAAIHEIETRNGMPDGALRAKLTADGVGMRTLVDQIRVQLGWTRVLREQLGESAAIKPSDIAEQQKLLKQMVGRPEFRVSEIFIPVDDPANTADAQKFAETVISELRAGAPFPVVAAQFSQSQTALQGGDLGWVQPNQLDPEVARVVQEMPVGAISNPLRVPGGYSIATLRAKREIGRDVGTMVSLRQVFFPFSQPLNPQAPTEQQRQALERAKAVSGRVHSCAEMEAAAKANNSPRPADPGDVRLESVNPPQFRQMLASLPTDRASQPLVAHDGIAVVIVCSRDQKNLAELSKDEIGGRLISERVELLSRQLQRDLRRRAMIDVRAQKVAGGA